MKKVSVFYGLVAICLLNYRLAYAVEAGNVLKNIEQNTSQPKDEFAIKNPQTTFKQGAMLGRLSATKINAPLLNLEIRDYWASKIGKTIYQQDIEKFKSWAWTKFREAGYLAYVTTAEVKVDDGIHLSIDVQTPKIGRVKLDLANQPFNDDEKAIFENRIARDFAEGDGIDTIKLDNRLQNSSHGFPLQFYANLKQVAPGVSDVIVTSPLIQSTPGKRLDTLVQINNYGLKQYGQTQGFVMGSFSGFTPLSQLRVFGQASEGIQYGRLQYLSPAPILRGELDIYASYADFTSLKNTSTATKGYSSELGIGLGHLLAFTRQAAVKSNVAVSYRQTENELKLLGTPLTELRSIQGRIALTMDNNKIDADQFDASMVFVGGNYDNADANSKSNGGYGKLEMAGRYTLSLSQDRNTVLQTRARGQWAATNLDAFDRISLGGINGVRAYTSVDGVGDQGGLISFDLVQKLPYQQYVGMFYDGGWVKPFKHADVGVNNDAYTLQAVGMQYGINYKNAALAMILSKGVGSYDAYVDGNDESSPRNWRGNISFTLSF